jgi:NAD(P)-dependent dehydrogenase (short-subunit alcohol dehydrogenase family)
MGDYEGRGLLAGTHALITGGDSGIGRAVAVAFAKEGAGVAIAYLSEREDDDAAHTADLVGKAGRRCAPPLSSDLAREGPAPIRRTGEETSTRAQDDGTSLAGLRWVHTASHAGQ